MILKSGFLQEIQDRGFISNITHKAELDEACSSNNIVPYIGFDCTAQSLHVGSLIQIMILRKLQKYGYKPIILLGGATTKIGDPTGRDTARQVLSEEKINSNLEGIKATISKFIDEKNATFVNNDDWLENVKYLEFLRDIGKFFSINQMLTFDSVKTRLERESQLSFLEFNYMILQAYDFLVLNQKQNCNLQIGGSDQWGNIVNGVDLVRRVEAKQVFGLTTILLETTDGKKMGKTADGAVWLDSNMLSPFDYFQYFRNIEDVYVEKFLFLFTDLSSDEIKTELSGNINKAKERLAFEATKICHGEDEANSVLKRAHEIFLNKDASFFEKIDLSYAPEEFASKRLIEALRDAKITESASEARRLVKGGGVKVNQKAVADENIFIGSDSFLSQNSIEKSNFIQFDLSIGKKRFFKFLINLK